MQNYTLELNLFDATFDPEDPRLPEKFRSKFEIRDIPRHHLADGPCWIWVGTLSRYGYGLFHAHNRKYNAHKMAYTLLGGVIAEGLMLDHLCRNPACINPSHLEPVTHKENQARGIGTLTALNAAKTACPKGHPYDSEHGRVHDGYRYCRTCNVERKREVRRMNGSVPRIFKEKRL